MTNDDSESMSKGAQGWGEGEVIMREIHILWHT
jgi:hypothetical protein